MSPVFGVSFGEIAVIALVVLVVVGPQKLPGMLRSLGQWIRKARIMTSEVRAQTGIDEILRQEGIDGGLAELRGMLRGDLGGFARPAQRDQGPEIDPYARLPREERDWAPLDVDREYPAEGVDAAGAVPDDLVADEAVVHSPESTVS